MKNIVEINKLHDLFQYTIDRREKTADSHSISCLRAAHGVICWIMGHADDGPIAEFIINMNKNEKGPNDNF